MRWAQQQRMEFISRHLKAQGYLNRADLMTTFGISTAQASIDIHRFLNLYPLEMHYNLHTKRYEKGAPSVLLRNHR